MEKKRDQWGSNFGFLMAAIGSAVGLGNIWGFPYKMGMNGGFAFLVIYLVLVALVGFPVMLGEISIGRKSGKGALGAYKTIGKNVSWIGFLGVASGFLILSFYSVLGGIVLRYMVSFFMEMFKPGSGFSGLSSGDFFGTFITSSSGMMIFYVIFLVATAAIVMGGIEGGIEKFSKIAMPALFVMLLIVIIRSVTLPGASAGLAFMLKPNFSVFDTSNGGVGFFNVLKTAAGQMFFSLSLGMGAMVTYGSYLGKKENIEKNSFIIPIADTVIAIMAGLAVMPAVFAFGIEPGAGPGLLFVSLHTVFIQGMGGFIGLLFGFVFYLLVFIAAVTSSISLLEVCTTCFMDNAVEKGKSPNRKIITLVISLVVFVVGIPVALDGLGGGGLIPVPGKLLGLEKYPVCLADFLDFYDMISEGIFMPVGALAMSLVIGYKVKTSYLKDEVELNGNKLSAFKFWDICYKFIIPVILIIVLYGQIQSFF